MKVCRLVSIKHFHQVLTVVHKIYVEGNVDIGLDMPSIAQGNSVFNIQSLKNRETLQEMKCKMWGISNSELP